MGDAPNPAPQAGVTIGNTVVKPQPDQIAFLSWLSLKWRTGVLR